MAVMYHVRCRFTYATRKLLHIAVRVKCCIVKVCLIWLDEVLGNGDDTEDKEKLAELLLKLYHSHFARSINMYF